MDLAVAIVLRFFNHKCARVKPAKTSIGAEETCHQKGGLDSGIHAALILPVCSSVGMTGGHRALTAITLGVALVRQQSEMTDEELP